MAYTVAYRGAYRQTYRQAYSWACTAVYRATYSLACGLVGLGLVGLVPAQAQAAETQYQSAWQRGETSAVRLIAASDFFSGLGGTSDTADSARDKQTMLAGLEFQLDEGWKTYWHTPGSAGFGAETNWSASENLRTAEIRWPLPERFSLFGEDALGYGGDRVILPLLVSGLDANREIKLKGDVFYLVCKTLCIPHQAQVALTLPAPQSTTNNTAEPSNGTSDSPHQERLLHALARVPIKQDHSVRLVSQTITQDQFVGAELNLSLDLPVALAEPQIVGASNEALFGKAEKIQFLEDPSGRTRLVFALPLHTAPGLNPRQLAGQAFSISLADTAAPVGTAAHRGWELASTFPLLENFNLTPILFLALLGGLILNFMPCVLPVLTLKILHLLRLREEAEQGDEAQFLHQVRRGFVVSSLGIYTAFLGLGIAVASTVALARTAGWGVQFQSPTFLVVMALTLTLFTAWVWGWWRVSFSFGSFGALAGGTRKADLASGAGLASHPDNHQDNGDKPQARFLSDFAAGLLATLLATPCSAPFLGTAVGFALTLNPADTLLIFFAMATGFAAPWLVFAAVPGWARFLPRPGAWMERLERLLGFGLLLTALWLVSLLGGAMAWLGALLLAGLLILLGRAHKNAGRRASGASQESPLVSRLGVASLIVALLLLPYTFLQDENKSGSPTGTDTAPRQTLSLPAPWQTFTPRAVEVAVTGNRVALVTFTADWCVSCKVNESLVLRSNAVEQMLAEDQVVALVGDWTNPDGEISDWLAHHGRYGIPFTAIYGPGALEGLLLPELLTQGAVLEALEQARKN